MEKLSRHSRVGVALPLAVARRIVEAARHEWGTEAEHELRRDRTEVRFFLGGRRHLRRGGQETAVAAIEIHWQAPLPSQATIERISWDPHRGSSPEEIGHVVDTLAGYPVWRRGVERGAEHHAPLARAI